MRKRLLKLAGACAAALAFAMPASAFNVNLDIVGQDLNVSLSALGSDVVNAYDVYLDVDASIWSDITDVVQTNALGNPNDIFETIALTDLTTPGVIEALLVSFIPNATLAASQADPLPLFSSHPRVYGKDTKNK